MSPADRDKKGVNDVDDESRGPTPFEKFVAATKRVLSVSKAELDKRESTYRKRRAKKRRGG